jgi:hypothetical protein
MKTITTLVVLALPAAAQQSTFTSETERFAWSANAGWIDVATSRPAPGDGVRVSDTRLSGFAWSANTGWIHFGDGTPSDGIRYSNGAGDDSGVNHDGAGNLSGLAWSANTGWINFGWAAADDPNRPRFDLLTGGFSGHAWSPNTGWINLGTGLLRTVSMAVEDSDGDGISDTWELAKTGKLTALNKGGDADGDGRTDHEEYVADTNPLVPDQGLRVLNFSRDQTTGVNTLAWTSSPARLYVIESNPSLAPLKGEEVSNLSGSAATETSTTVFSQLNANFYRIHAKIPLAP